MKNSAAESDNIFLWILEQERQRDREKLHEDMAHRTEKEAVEKKNNCPKCKKHFFEAKLVQYYACPHCLHKLEETSKTGCQYWFGFLSQKDKSEAVPQECVECEKVMDCMLNRHIDSVAAVSEIKKWYTR